MTSERLGLVWTWARVSLALLGADSGVQRSKATTPPSPGQAAAPESIRFLAGGESRNRRNWLPRLFAASVCSGLSEDSDGAQPADPLHAI
jgi:hypothetical protein